MELCWRFPKLLGSVCTKERFLGNSTTLGGSYLKGYKVLLLFLVANLISRPSMRTFEIFDILGTNMSPRHFWVDDFPFHHVAHVWFPGGYAFSTKKQPHRNSAGGAHPLISGWDCNHICCAEERWDQRGDGNTTCHDYTPGRMVLIQRSCHPNKRNVDKVSIT